MFFRGINVSFFVVDGAIILLYFMLSLPFLASYLRKAKIVGAEFEFKDEISKAKKAVEDAIQDEKENPNEFEDGWVSVVPKEEKIFDLSTTSKLVYEDHILALAGVRIEIERKLRNSAYKLGLIENEFVPLRRIVDLLFKNKYIRESQYKVLIIVIDLCNKAVHGLEVSQGEALEVIELVDIFNRSFSIGYSIDINANEDFEKQGLLCEWQHCIESMPCQNVPLEKLCPLFGHDCPGGIERVASCKSGEQ